MKHNFRANGKLLLTGEYFVLDGVPALAVPTKLGQRLDVFAERTAPDAVSWVAYDVGGEPWLTVRLQRGHWISGPQDTPDASSYLANIFHQAERLNPGCTDRLLGCRVETRLEFDRHWGLGSSSTLISMLAEWLEVNPYELLAATFGGSGYDLACAFAAGPILYERSRPEPKVRALDWHPTWVRQTCFVYRNQKQNSREGIRAYRDREVSEAVKAAIGEITLALVEPSLHPRAAAQLLRQHEELVSQTLLMDPIQASLFPDFSGQLKSLGAWGGDFFWALSEESPEKVRAYFNERGYATVIGYEEMVL